MFSYSLLSKLILLMSVSAFFCATPVSFAYDYASRHFPVGLVMMAFPQGLRIQVPQRIDLNTADANQLSLLPAVDYGVAQAIIRHRPYQTLDGLHALKADYSENFVKYLMAELKPLVSCKPVSEKAEQETLKLRQ